MDNTIEENWKKAHARESNNSRNVEPENVGCRCWPVVTRCFLMTLPTGGHAETMRLDRSSTLSSVYHEPFSFRCLLWCTRLETSVSRKEWANGQTGKRVRIVSDEEQWNEQRLRQETESNRKCCTICFYVVYRNNSFDRIKIKKSACIGIECRVSFDKSRSRKCPKGNTNVLT